MMVIKPIKESDLGYYPMMLIMVVLLISETVRI
jgi:hypothetical protein